MKFVCPVCGYVYEGDAAPEKCPQCGVPGSKFTVIDDNGSKLVFADEHKIGVGRLEGVPEEIVEGLRANFTGECTEVGMYLAIKDGAAFYPDQEIAAAGAVEGKTDDGFYYIIVNQIGSQIEEIIKDYKPGDEVTKLEVPEVDNEVTVPTDELGGVVIPSTTTETVMPGDGVELG